MIVEAKVTFRLSLRINSSVGKRVFAYSVDPADTTKIVREDASGKTSVGRLVNGRFRTLSAKTP
jgi:hypothetical protein